MCIQHTESVVGNRQKKPNITECSLCGKAHVPNVVSVSMLPSTLYVIMPFWTSVRREARGKLWRVAYYIDWTLDFGRNTQVTTVVEIMIKT